MHTHTHSLCYAVLYNRYTYLQIGMIQASAGFFCYFVVMSDSGWWPAKLIGLRDDYHDEDVIVTDSYQQEWLYDERMRCLSAAQTSCVPPLIRFLFHSLFHSLLHNF